MIVIKRLDKWNLRLNKKREKMIENLIVKVNPLLTLLFPFVGVYKHSVRVNIGMTNRKGVVGHEQYAKIFGTARELFGLDRIPNFAQEAGKIYLLKTCEAQYKYFDNFVFGDVILAIVRVTQVNGASVYLQCVFVNKKTKKIHAVGEQLVAYTDMSGIPKRLPYWLSCLNKLICSKKHEDFESSPSQLKGQTIFRTEMLVTTEMTNAEKNVSHDEFPKIMSRAIEEHILRVKNNNPDGIETLDVIEASYAYKRDYFFGDRIVVNLSAAYEPGRIVYWARLENEKGELRSYCKQAVRIPEAQVAVSPKRIEASPVATKPPEIVN